MRLGSRFTDLSHLYLHLSLPFPSLPGLPILSSALNYYRSEERAHGAIESLTKELPDSASKLIYLPFDLTDLASAQEAVRTYLAKEDRLDIVSE